jgi:hypothetical protein
MDGGGHRVGVVGRVETLCLPVSEPDDAPVMSGVGQHIIDTTIELRS